MGILVRLLALYLGGMPLYAGTTGGTHLLTRGPGAEGAALGNSVLSKVQDPTALYWNPAGLARAGGTITGEHLMLYGGARYNFVGLSLPSKLGSFGLGMLQLHRGNIVARSSIADPGFKVSNTQSDYLLGFARRLGRWWSGGATINVLDFNLAGHRDMGVGLDLGLQGILPGKDIAVFRRPIWSVGGVLKNLVEPGLRLMDDRESLPREFRLGGGLGFDGLSRLSMRSGEIRHDRMRVLASLRKVMGEPTVHMALGVDYGLHDLLTLRLGFEDSLVAGLGITTKDGRFRVDYALENRPLSKNHRLTLSYRFTGAKAGEGLPKTVERDDSYLTALRRAAALSDEHFVRGKKAFADQRYARSLEDLEIAALLKPEDQERAAFHGRAMEVHRRSRAKSLGEVWPAALKVGRAKAAYEAVADLVVVLPPGADAGKDAVRTLRARIAPEDYAAISGIVLEERRSRVLNLAAQHRYADALRTAESLEVFASTRTAALKTFVAGQSEGFRERLAAVHDGSRRSGRNAVALQAALALKRAFPHDTELGAEAEEIRKTYLAKLSLSAKERLYLRKLYYLAALKYAKKDHAGAADLLQEILRRNAADEHSNHLKDVLLRKGLMREVFDDTTQEENKR